MTSITNAKFMIFLGTNKLLNFTVEYQLKCEAKFPVLFVWIYE